MPVYKDDKRGTWYVRFKQRDWTGKTKAVWKRGFETKREAVQWELEYKTKEDCGCDMPLKMFVELYLDTMDKRTKVSTMETKKNIINNQILPYLGERKVSELTTADIIKWQNKIMSIKNQNDKPYTSSYLKTVHNQLSAILNHAVKYYGLSRNVASLVGNMGTDKDIEMSYWTYDQYKKFSDAMMEDELVYYYAFEILYWCGIREGELLALTPSDVDLEKKEIRINKTFHNLRHEKYVTSPKTRKSNRVVAIPEFLADEIADYLEMCYKPAKDERLFKLTKSMLSRAITRGSKKANVPDIRVHDLRHSHVSLLINKGYSALEIADRVGHESINITYKYSHLFPDNKNQVAKTLDRIRKEEGNE